MKRENERKRRVDLLVEKFEDYLAAFNKEPPFTRPDQLQKHLAAMALRRQIGSAGEAVRHS